MLNLFGKRASPSKSVPPQSLTHNYGEMPLEELRQQILEQREFNRAQFALHRQAIEAILAILKGKMARREMMPCPANLKFLGKTGIEKDVHRFKYDGGFFTVTFQAYWNYDERCIEVSVLDAHHVGAHVLGYVVLTGERYLYS